LQINKSAVEFGEQLLADLGCGQPLSGIADHPAIAWKRSGLLELSGQMDGPATMAPLPLASAADGAMMALKALCEDSTQLPENGSILIGERARLMNLNRNGKSSAGGHCRIIDAMDGRYALNLAREDDWLLLAAWLEQPASNWRDIRQISRSRSAHDLVQRGVELGMAISVDELPEVRPWFEETKFLSSTRQPNIPLVVDLSSLWAGPLAGNLFKLMGAAVIKVESLARPDGARQGNGKFYELLNGGKKCAAFDFNSQDGLSDLKTLIAAADIVIEASRPRALKQLGIDAESLISEKPGKTWLRLIAHGDDQNRIGFGDDIGIAAGLTTVMERAWGRPLFAGDAIADPLSGIFGALAVWSKWQSGGGNLINLSMRDVVRYAMQVDDFHTDWAAVARDWQNKAEANDQPLYPIRKNSDSVHATGAETIQIMASLC